MTTILERTGELVAQRRHQLAVKADRLFGYLMFVQYAAAVIWSFIYTPATYSGSQASVHPHLLAAIFVGGLIALPSAGLAFSKPGRPINPFILSLTQMMMGSLLIHVSGGRIETHFHVFVSLAFLAFYRDVRVILPATLWVVVDHAARGVYFPQSIFGTNAPGAWRLMEHSAWVIFEDVILALSIRQSSEIIRQGAEHQAQVESSHEMAAALVAKRTDELMRTEAQSEAVLKSALDGIVVIDSAGRIVRMNPAALAIFEISGSNYEGKEFSRFLKPAGHEGDRADYWRRIAAKSVKGGEGRLEMNLVRERGEEFPAELTIVGNEFDGSFAYTAFIRDISDQKRLEAKLAHAQKMEGMGELAAGIAHEINTPNQYLSDNVRFLRDGFAKLSRLLDAYRDENATPEARKAMEKEIDLAFLIEEIPCAIDEGLEGIERVSGIVRAMKEISHPGLAQRSAVDINRVVSSTVTIARHEWKHVAKVELELDENLPPVNGNQGELGQVVLNLLMNATHAVRAAHEAGGMGKIKIKTSFEYDRVRISVQDDGCGIPENVLPRIFDPFFTTKDVGTGTGQGLAISRSVIDRHRGEVDVESTVGKGTTFNILLPAMAGASLAA